MCVTREPGPGTRDPGAGTRDRDPGAVLGTDSWVLVQVNVAARLLFLLQLDHAQDSGRMINSGLWFNEEAPAEVKMMWGT